MARRRLAVVVGMTSLVALGAVFGVAADRLYLAHAGGGHSAPQMHAEALEQFRTILDLDDAQVAAIDSIFRHRQGEVESTWQTLSRHLHSVVDSVHREVMHVLRPEQRAAFEKWLRESGGHSLPGHLPASDSS